MIWWRAWQRWRRRLVSFRRATTEDYPLLEQMHRAQGFPYPLPPLNDRSLVEKIIAEVNGKPAYAALLRLTSEAYLLGKPDGLTAREKWETIKQGNDLLMDCAIGAGFDDVTCSVPPLIAARFGKRLEKQLGWERNPWPHYSIWVAGKGV